MKEFFIKRCNATLRYHDLAGSGIPVVFIHGIGCASSADYPQVAREGTLANRRCILVDLLGAGYSDKPDSFDYAIDSHAEYLEEFINSLGLGKVSLYAHSMGGAVALSLAARLGDKLASIVLSEANLDAGGGFFSQQIAAFSEQDYVNDGHAQTVMASIDSGNGRWAASLQTWSPIAVYRCAISLIEGGGPCWRDILYSLEVPKAYIFGELSLPDDDYEELEYHGIEVLTVSNAGHSMAWENPKGLARAISHALK